MRFRNAFRILLDNFSNVYKLLLFRIITGLISLSIAYVILTRGLHVIFESPEAQNISELFKDLLRTLSTGKPEFSQLVDFRDAMISAVAAFLVMVGTNVGSIVASFIGLCALYLFSRFLNGTASFAVGSVLNDRLAAYSRTKFSSAYFRNLGKSMLYHLIYVPIGFVYDIASLVACWFFFFYTPSLMPWGGFTILLGLSLSVAAFICLQALKLTFISGWIPAMVTDGKGVLAGCRQSFQSLKGFGGRFSNYLVTIYLIAGVCVLFGICTFGSFLLIAVPAGLLMVLCLQFVFYYEDNNKKYFLSFRKISGADGKPESMGD